MKVLIVVTFALTLAVASNLNSSETEIVPRGRILNGQDANPKEFPYIVGLSIKDSDSKRTWCGGTLIKKNWVLTAAHCLQDFVKVYVLLGASNRKKYDKILAVKAKDTITHKDYNDGTKMHDIALIKIPPVDFTEHIQTIELPAKGNSNYGGEKVLVAGWGHTITEKMNVDKLQWGRMEVIGNDECEKISKKFVSRFRINAKAVDSVSTGYGDSGGSLVLESNPNILIGVGSLGAKPGCNTDIRDIFTNVQAYLNWINKMTK